MRREAGMSLISLMVGLALSMVALVALLYAYRGVVVNVKSTTAKGRAQVQSASSLLAAEQMIQQAGWGSGPTASPPGGMANIDVVLLSGAKLTGTVLTGLAKPISSTLESGNALVWSSSLSGSSECTALLIVDGGVTRHGPIACTSASSWPSLSWPSSAVMLAQPQALSANAQLQAQMTPCWPYGGSPTGLRLAVQVTLANMGSANPSLCLLNITR